MKTLIAAIAIMTALTGAHAKAQDAMSPKDVSTKLTVNDVNNIGNALRSLSTYPTLDANKNLVRLPHPTGTYRFSGAVLFSIAMNLKRIDEVVTAFQETHRSMTKQVYGDETAEILAADPKRQAEAAKKQAELQFQIDKAAKAPAGIEMTKIKEKDLCLDAAPPACPQANPIPIDVLTLMLPIIER